MLNVSRVTLLYYVFLVFSLYVIYFYTFRDLVHRQIALDALAHMTLGVCGFGCEDALTHLLNFIWPNVFEISPHLVQRFIFACEGMRVSLGTNKVLQYCLQVTLNCYTNYAKCVI